MFLEQKTAAATGSMADLFKWIGMGRAPSGVKEIQANARVASADTPGTAAPLRALMCVRAHTRTMRDFASDPAVHADNKGVVYEEPNTLTASIFGGLSPRSQDPPPTPRAPVTMSSDPNADKHPATAGTKDVGELQEKLESLGVRCAGPPMASLGLCGPAGLEHVRPGAVPRRGGGAAARHRHG